MCFRVPEVEVAELVPTELELVVVDEVHAQNYVSSFRYGGSYIVLFPAQPYGVWALAITFYVGAVNTFQPDVGVDCIPRVRGYH